MTSNDNNNLNLSNNIFSIKLSDCGKFYVHEFPQNNDINILTSSDYISKLCKELESSIEQTMSQLKSGAKRYMKPTEYPIYTGHTGLSFLCYCLNNDGNLRSCLILLLNRFGVQILTFYFHYYYYVLKERALKHLNIALQYLSERRSSRATILEGQSGVFMLQHLLDDKKRALKNIESLIESFQFDCDEMLYGRAGTMVIIVIVIDFRKRKI
jgi:hypothetical protein